MDCKFPEEFDLIVVGTGMVESILSAAASRIGKRVLHLDKNDYYGGQWTSFNLHALQNLQENKCGATLEKRTEQLIEDDDVFNAFGNKLFDIKDFKVLRHVSDDKQETSAEAVQTETTTDSAVENVQIETKPTKKIWDRKQIEDMSRKFNIDLIPKLQFARGKLVELLISSNIARYSEYRSVSRILIWLDGKLEVVPCSRVDVFTNDKVLRHEKRALMKLLTSLNEEDLLTYETATYREFLEDNGLTPNLINFVLYAISMSNDSTLYLEGLRRTQRFLASLGRFGKTPFLFSMYGSGDINQAFCRLSAVFGGIFALDQPIQGFKVEENKFKTAVVGDQKIRADHLVMSIEYAPEKYVNAENKKYISRCVLITDKSVLVTEKEHLTLVIYPPEEGNNAVNIIELGTLTGTCPKDLYLVHLISNQTNNPEEDFKHVINKLFSIESKDPLQEKPLILYSFYFSLPNTNEIKFETPSNVFLCPGPDSDLDYDLSIQKAEEIFHNMYPDLEFLPRAPDPEEIIIGEEDDEDLQALQEE